MALVAAPSSAASWQELDARTLARGGVSALERLDHSPAAPVPDGLTLQGGGVWHFLGSGLEARSLRLHQSRGGAAWSLGIDWMQSDIHREQDVVAALQLRRGGARVGIAVGLREARFAGYGVWRRGLMRFGVGAQPHARVQLALAVDRQPEQSGRPRFAAAAGAALDGGLDVAVQLEREPALSARLRASLGWTPAPALGILCGYDTTTSSFAAGVALGVGPWRLIFGTSSHPELGWSQAWMLEWGR